IPDHITSYGIGAFAGSGLTRAVIPAHITAVGEQAFSECTSLEDVEIRCPSSAFEVGSYYYMEFFKNVPFHAPNSTETNLSIPADWTEIPDYLFRYSALLDTDFLTDVPALTRLGTRSFAEMPVLERVTIPGTVTTIGSQAFYESFDCVSTLVIPESVTTLEYTSAGTRQQFFTLNTTLRDVYIMNPDLDLRQADFELHVATPAQHGTKLVFNWKNYSDGEEYLTLHAAAASTAIGLAGASEGHYIFTALGEGKPITAVVKTPEGRDVTADCTFRWVNAQGNESTGSILYPATEGLTYTLYAELSEELLRTYPAPAARKVTSSGEAQTVEIVLGTLPAHTFTGTVTDEAGRALPGAAVTLIQQYNGIQTETDVGVTDADGAFTVTAFEAPSQVRVKLDDYYTGTAAVLPGAGEESTAFEPIKLKGLPATTILLNPVVTTADAAASGPVDLADLTFKVTRKDSDTPLAHTIQDTTLVLTESVGIAEELELTVTDVKERAQLAWSKTPIGFTLQQTQVDIPLTEYGRFSITAEDYNAASGQWVWVYDRIEGNHVGTDDWMGPLVAVYEMTSGSVQSEPLPAGDYRVVVIDKTCPFYSPANYYYLTGADILDGSIQSGGGWLGLNKSAHFAEVDVTVTDGELTEAPIASVPRYAEATGVNDRFEDVFEKAEIGFSNASPIVGQDYYVWFDFSIKEEYRGRITTDGWHLDIYLPAHTRFNDVYPSYLGDKIVPQPNRTDTEGTQLIRIDLPVGMQEGRYTFSLQGLARSPAASITFAMSHITLNGTPISQSFEIRDVKIDPGFDRSTELTDRTVTVTAPPYSYITLYLDGAAVGTKKANNLGTADFTVTYPQPYYEGASWRLTAAYQLEEDGELIDATDSVTVYYGNRYELGAVLDLPGDMPNSTIDMNLRPRTGRTLYRVDSKDPYWSVTVDEGKQEYVQGGVITLWGFRDVNGKTYDVLELPGDIPNSTINMNLRPRTGKVRYFVGSKDPYWSVTVDEGKQQYVKDGVITLWGFRDMNGNTYDVLELQQVGDTNVFRGKPDDNFHYYSVAIDYDVTEAYREQQEAMPIQIPAAAYAEYEANLQQTLADAFTVEDDPDTEAKESTEALDYQDVPATQYTGFDQLSEADQQKLLEADASYQAIFSGLQDASEQIAALFGQMPNWGWQGEMTLRNNGYEVLDITEEQLEAYQKHEDYTTYWMEDPTIESIKEYPVCVYTGLDKMEIINGQTLTLTRLRYTEEASEAVSLMSSGGVITSQKKNGLTKVDESVSKDNVDADCPSYASIYEEAKKTADNAKTAMNIGSDSVSVAIEQAEAWLEANRELFESDLGGAEFDRQYVKLASSARMWKNVLDQLPIIGNVLDVLTLGDLVAEQMSADAEAASARGSFHRKYKVYADNPRADNQEKCVLKAQAHLNAAIDYQNALANQTVSTSFQLVGALAAAIGLLGGGVGAVPGLLLTLGSTAVDWHLGNLTDIAKQNLLNASNNDPMGDRCPDGIIPPPGGVGAPTGPLHDPSGYIYEGVFSNRVEGVTASVWYQGETGQPVLWTEAASTGQDNPYTSHSDGYYGWVTPEGKWAVMFEKDDYQSADSRNIYKVLRTLEADGD
ncbi:MAG: leucine-rich repeat protein, partial [Ruminiclostridium sp.]|nr:leucine-rich repeat protein [Ruminiclostridium sp.]